MLQRFSWSTKASGNSTVAAATAVVKGRRNRNGSLELRVCEILVWVNDEDDSRRPYLRSTTVTSLLSSDTNGIPAQLAWEPQFINMEVWVHLNREGIGGEMWLKLIIFFSFGTSFTFATRKTKKTSSLFLSVEGLAPENRLVLHYLMSFLSKVNLSSTFVWHAGMLRKKRRALRKYTTERIYIKRISRRTEVTWIDISARKQILNEIPMIVGHKENNSIFSQFGR